jgi:predicted  nucleic acid-binding Zn-ribbon protein
MEKDQKDRLCEVLEQVGVELGGIREELAAMRKNAEGTTQRMVAVEQATGDLNDTVREFINHTFETVNQHGRKILAIRQHHDMETSNGAGE